MFSAGQSKSSLLQTTKAAHGGARVLPKPQPIIIVCKVQPSPPPPPHTDALSIAIQPGGVGCGAPYDRVRALALGWHTNSVMYAPAPATGKTQPPLPAPYACKPPHRLGETSQVVRRTEDPSRIWEVALGPGPKGLHNHQNGPAAPASHPGTHKPPTHVPPHTPYCTPLLKALGGEAGTMLVRWTRGP